MEEVKEAEDVEDEAAAASVGRCLARKVASFGMADCRYYTLRRIQSEDLTALGKFSVAPLGGHANMTGAPILLVGYSPRPVLIIFHPSLSRLSTSALGIAVMPQATL